MEKMKALFARAPEGIQFSMGIVCPEDAETLKGALVAAEQKVITPVFIGRIDKINEVAAKLGSDISTYQCIDANSEEEAATKAVEMAKEGLLNALMKGNLHTETFMAKIVSRDGGLRTDRRMTHGMLVDVPSYHKLLICSDVAFNIKPSLKEKKDIVQNAINFAMTLGIKLPKVALLSSVDVPSEKVPSSLDCADLCKMAERGEITGGLLAGPLQFDAAISTEVARTKKLSTSVAGDPDILIFPDLDSGNIAVKVLEHCANATCYGVALGAKVPVIVLSRAATAESRVGSCLLSKFIANYGDITD